MSVVLVDKYVKNFIGEHEYANIQGAISTAHASFVSKSGAGSDFLGWATLPTDYDREEFDRIVKAAERIKSVPWFKG